MHEEGTLIMAVDEQIPEAQDSGGEQPAEQLAPPVNENFKWYIIHAYSGFERKVRESLESRIQAFGLQNRIGRIMIPTEPVTELRNGKKYTIERVFLPGYVLVEMELDNDLWHVIKNTPRVTGFLGTGDKPVALSEAEVSSILFRSETSKDKPSMKVKFEKGEQVRINEGPFANFNGTVDDVNEDRQTLKVMVSIFGRSTPVEIEFAQVDKMEEYLPSRADRLRDGWICERILDYKSAAGQSPAARNRQRIYPWHRRRLLDTSSFRLPEERLPRRRRSAPHSARRRLTSWSSASSSTPAPPRLR
jgi:transcriptional antiterminator NusG